MKKLERQFETRFRKQLKEVPRSWWLEKSVSTSLRGVPDIIGIVNGRFVALELKASGKEVVSKTKTTELQRYVLEKIWDAGGYAEFVTPHIADDVLEDLRRIK